MSDVTSRVCKCCESKFQASNPYLEFCSLPCIETYFGVQQEELLGRKNVQLKAAAGLVTACQVCQKPTSRYTKRGTLKLVCGPVCSSKLIPKHTKTERPCVHCDTPVFIEKTIRPAFVRCTKHRTLWPKVQAESARNCKKVKMAEPPFDQYLVKGPWWDSKRRALTVLLMHSSASSQREMDYSLYLLSVKEGKRLSDTTPVVHLDGDRLNVEISNLARG